MKTILITGCSSGFGLEIARHFLDRDWNVIATMRTPREDLLPRSARLRVLPLDVTDPQSIAAAVDAAGPIDVLVNNAGIGVLNALEGTTMDIARMVFETNTLGTIAMTRAVLPRFRERQAGRIVNITSSVTLKPLPLLSVYTASKAAINAFTESLALELQPFHVQVNLVLPGRAPDTAFGDNARPLMQDGFPEAYGSFAQRVLAESQQSSEITLSRDVAEAVWRAVNDPACPLRIPAGADAVAVAGVP
ncbi:SDR family oxidoreductase [Rhodanobacter sp. FDAARGOS 1247]|jgi:NAD(P)-dependent dehydrogenase (short-subunit alcohol dehydrogenase family)|uniref:SDR family oxidoreductase n=1 Tax=Rhodanobacter sp. FDAARGOS 1247 TaxID=2778082 RepID=UPI001951C588|nr:SDR family oxidoreductase [Rhodanobacter sp. FDAARGOS 1247]QRP63062.1 SDR family oxidoreductase [Rhodanobacter sp. FDAARGOS 1247]